MSANEREKLTQFLNRYAKWYDDNYGDGMPDKNVLDSIYQWLGTPFTDRISRKKFRILFDLRLTDYRERKKG